MNIWVALGLMTVIFLLGYIIGAIMATGRRQDEYNEKMMDHAAEGDTL